MASMTGYCWGAGALVAAGLEEAARECGDATRKTKSTASTMMAIRTMSKSLVLSFIDPPSASPRLGLGEALNFIEPLFGGGSSDGRCYQRERVLNRSSSREETCSSRQTFRALGCRFELSG